MWWKKKSYCYHFILHSVNRFELGLLFVITALMPIFCLHNPGFFILHVFLSLLSDSKELITWTITPVYYIFLTNLSFTPVYNQFWCLFPEWDSPLDVILYKNEANHLLASPPFIQLAYHWIKSGRLCHSISKRIWQFFVKLPIFIALYFPLIFLTNASIYLCQKTKQFFSETIL